MQKANKLVFIGLHIVAWLIFVGLSIEACGLLVNFVISLYRPEWIQNLYQKLDLMAIYDKSTWIFLGIYSFILSIAFLKAFLFYILVMLMHKMDLSKPFSHYVAQQFAKISYFTLSIGFLGYLAQQYSKRINHYGYDTLLVDQFWKDYEAFILMGAVVYIIATIFKKGVELQNENDLTV